jgi:hypothetical protein
MGTYMRREHRLYPEELINPDLLGEIVVVSSVVAFVAYF